MSEIAALQEEQWKPIDGFPGYEISSHGRVRSIDRTVTSLKRGPQKFKGRIIRPAIGTNGYLGVVLSKNSKLHTRSIHVLVANAFLGPRPEGYDVCHNDGIRFNNITTNLRYDTRSQNMKDKAKHGRIHNSAKLTREEVAEIRNLLGNENQRAIAEQYGVTQGAISLIAIGKTWRTSL